MQKYHKVISKIREIREQKNYSQEYMANVLDVSLKTYSNIENTNSDLSLTKLFKISEILETPIEDFFGASNFKYKNCDNSGYHSNYVYEDKIGFSEAIKAWQQIVAQQKEEIAFLKRLLEH